MTPVRALIVDDEPLARERLRTLLGARADVEVAGECQDGAEAIAAIPALAPDLVFLDVQMPEVDGFEVVARLGPAQMPAVIFATAYDRHALRAFEVHALDYLLKPFDLDRFDEAVTRAVAQLRAAGPADLPDRLAELLADLRPARPWLERVMVKTRTRTYFVRLDEVDWIEAARNYVRLHVGAKTHLLRESLSHLETRLDPDRFVRIHRSAIVNLDRVKELAPALNGDYDVRLLDGTQLTLSRTYRRRLDRFRLG